MNVIPPYLEEVLTEAEEYYESKDSVTATDAAHEVAHQNQSLTRLEVSRPNTFQVLQDLRNLDTLCGDEFETYRSYRMGDYADSIIEALALRSLEEFIATYLSEGQSLTLPNTAKDREIEYLDIGGPDISTSINIHVTAKEAVDIENAVSNLADELDEDHPRQNQIRLFKRLWDSAVEGLNDTSVILTGADDANVLLEALAQYEPQETDYTARLRNTILEAINAPESPIDPEDLEMGSKSAHPTTAD